MTENQRIAIISASVGEGRTFAAAGLYVSLARTGKPVQLVGLDIEKPDLLAADKDLELLREEIESQYPVIDRNKCNFCGNCASHCAYNALIFSRYVPLVKFDASSCFVCAECVKACNRQGISLRPRKIGHLYYGSENHQSMLIGSLNQGINLQYPLIQLISERIDMKPCVVADFAPGLQPIAGAALQKMNYVLIVIDSQRFNTSEIEELIASVRISRLPFGMLFNKCDENQKKRTDFVQYCEHNSFPLLGFLPFVKFDINDLFSGINANHDLIEVFNSISRQIQAALNADQ